MATSDGFWSTRFGRWIGSTKNLVGLGLAVLALGAHLAVGLGALWPVVVVAAYGVGALVAPRGQVDLRLGLGATASAVELKEQLGLLRRSLRGPSGRLDPDLRASLDGVLATLDEVVGRWDELSGAPDQQHTVAQMIADYLPTSVQTYLNLPRAVTARVAYVPGTAFYYDGQGADHMRLSFCYPTPERIREGIRRLATVVAAEAELVELFGTAGHVGVEQVQAPGPDVA